ncbi:MAG TPA: dNTP triphosphohydrolase [Leadbetterella sp.]|nr:dNTP triphosphohydrolase [Leadbetterella sp.]
MKITYNDLDKARLLSEEEYNDESNHDECRTPFRVDCARVIHSYCFRRLAGKTQLFPFMESDFFRNRLTHSLEVAQIARTIATKLNRTYPDLNIDLDLVEFAGLAHDLGHPPFGHQGEEILAECMKGHGGFEGNAQTLRVLSKLEKKFHDGDLDRGGFKEENNEIVDRRYGLNLSFRSLASILKYDTEIPLETEGKVIKGYYSEEKDLVSKIKKSVLGGKNNSSEFKTIECQIMDIADDIAYSTYDLEDAFKAGFITPIDMLIQSDSFYSKISKDIFKSANIHLEIKDIKDIISDLLIFIFELPIEGIGTLEFKDLITQSYLFLAQQYSSKYSKLLVNNGYVRRHFTTQLIDASIDGISVVPNENLPALSKIKVDLDTKKRIEILKKIAFHTQVLSPKLKANERRGKKIVKKIFDSLAPDPNKLEKTPDLLPEDIKIIYNQKADLNHKLRTICDFISSMTDNYAIEFYARITSKNPISIFKPM